MLRVRVLGGLRAEIDGHEVELPAGRPAALLAWLAIHPGPHRRTDLAARFWPDVLDESSRASLRTALWTLRRALGDDALDTQKTQIALRDTVAVDVLEADELVRCADAPAALALCRGELLAGLDDDWVLDARDAHRRRTAELHEQVAATAEAGGDLAAAVRSSRRAAALDPLDERAHRALIRRLAAAGDRPGAIAVYERLRERMARDLALTPEPQTRAAVEAIRAADARPDGPADPEPASRLPPRLAAALPNRFAGRADARAALTDAWTRTVDGAAGALVIVTGEAGIGKTALAAVLGADVVRTGGGVLHGGATPEPLARHQVFAEALRDIATRGYVPPAHRPALAWIAPGLTDAVAGEVAPLALAEAIAASLAAAAVDRPLLVVLDDLHWADATAVAILRHVVAVARVPRVLIVATARPAAAGDRQPFAAALARLRRETPICELHLAGLDPGEVAVIAGAATIGHLHQRTGGVPLLVQATLAHVAAGGHGLPEGALALLNERLAAFDDHCRAALTTAALAGPEFDIAVIAAANGSDADTVAKAIEPAVSAGIVHELGGATRTERCVFAHAMFRDALTGDLSLANRRRVHARLAKAVAAVQGEHDDSAPLIAHHALAAGPASDIDAAVAIAGRAARVAAGRAAFADAAAFCDGALALLEGDDARRRRFVLLRALAFQALEHLAIGDVPGRAGEVTASNVRG